MNHGARWRGRIVALGIVGVMAFAVLTTTEAWPVTSLRLFSAVRTDRSSATRLVAIYPDGREATIRPDAEHDFTRRTAAQYHRLRTLPLAERQAKARAWCEAAGIDPDALHEVVLVRTRRVWDAAEGTTTVIAEDVTLHIPMGGDP